MNAPAKFLWDGTERRKPHSCRRLADRRCHQERRYDPRSHREVSSPRGFYGWLRSLIRARLGVDRRKSDDQRMINRRHFSPRSMLTREELADLLK
jgi:hypothetical protein